MGRRRVAALAAVLVVGLAAMVRAGPAAACSCAGGPTDTIEFVGRAEAPLPTTPDAFARPWRFEVVTATRGVQPHERVEVALRVPGPGRPPSDGTCETGVAIGRGGVYRVVANHTVLNGNTYNVVSLCDGSIEQVAAPARLEPVPDPFAKANHHRTLLLWAAGFGLVFVVIAPGVVMWRVQRMRNAASDDPFA